MNGTSPSLHATIPLTGVAMASWRVPTKKEGEMAKHYYPEEYPWPANTCYWSVLGHWRRIKEENITESEPLLNQKTERVMIDT